VILSLVFLLTQNLHAGIVRTVFSDNTTILPINLKMGQSTVLRFVEKPKRVVLGNINYYSVEFIDNDLAIKPLGAVTTNLFVYGMKNVYGFILRTNQSVNYDDLVQVDLKENKVSSQEKDSLVLAPFKEVSRPRLAFQVSNELKITLSKIQIFDGKDFYVIDLQFENTSKSELDLSKLEIVLNRSKLKLSPQEFVLRDQKVKAGEFSGARLFVSLNKKTDLTLEVHFRALVIKQIVSGRFL